MSLPRPTIVIFDMDGTSVRHLNPRLLHVMEWLDDASFKITRFISWLFKRKKQEEYIIEGESLEPKKKPKLLVHRAIHKVRRKDVEQIVEPCPGLYSILGLLTKNDIPLALVSNGLGKGYGHDILEKFDLGKYFKTAIFREDIQKSKPNPQPFLLALERMGITPAKDDVIWCIGDRHKDMTAAQNANKHIDGTVVPIAYGLNAAIAILDQGMNPDQIIMSYYDMYGRLKEMFVEKENAANSLKNEQGLFK